MTLPPLPKSLFRFAGYGYTIHDMHAYGKTCALAERERWRKAEGYALCVHPDDTQFLRELPEGQWVILQRKCVPSKETP